MKKTVILLTTILALVCIAPAFAQWWVHQATVKVPFAFDVGTTALPAGTYAVLTQSEGHTVLVENVDTGASAYFLERDILLSSAAPETKLVFRQDGSRHVLHQIQLLGDKHTHDLVHATERPELAQSAH